MQLECVFSSFSSSFLFFPLLSFLFSLLFLLLLLLLLLLFADAFYLNATESCQDGQCPPCLPSLYGFGLTLHLKMEDKGQIVQMEMNWNPGTEQLSGPEDHGVWKFL